MYSLTILQSTLEIRLSSFSSVIFFSFLLVLQACYISAFLSFLILIHALDLFILYSDTVITMPWLTADGPTKAAHPGFS